MRTAAGVVFVPDIGQLEARDCAEQTGGGKGDEERGVAAERQEPEGGERNRRLGQPSG
ncbi:hypothetical protein [Streptomyces sp. YIM S03343]